MQSKQSGFTLIELVIVIVVLGILSSFAVPKIGDLIERARIAKVESLAGTVKVAATIAHAQQIAAQLGKAESVDSDGDGTAETAMENRYPTLAGINDALADVDISATGDWTYVAADGKWQLNKAGALADGASCFVQYAVPTTFGAAPTITTDTSDCK